MAGMVHQLLDILEAEFNNYDELLKLAEHKTDVIVKGDVDELKKVTAQEGEFIGKNQKLERERDKLMGDIASVINKDKNTLNLTSLIEVLASQKEDQEVLRKVQKRLRDKLEVLKTINERNGMLVKQALNFIDYNMNVIQSSKSLPPVSYQYGGTERQAEGRNFFDTRR